MTDTIHWEEDGIGTCNLRLKQPTAIFDTAIVVNEFGTRLLCEHLKLRNQVGTPTDIKHPLSGKAWETSLDLIAQRKCRSQRVLSSLELRPQILLNELGAPAKLPYKIELRRQRADTVLVFRGQKSLTRACVSDRRRATLGSVQQVRTRLLGGDGLLVRHVPKIEQ